MEIMRSKKIDVIMFCMKDKLVKKSIKLDHVQFIVNFGLYPSFVSFVKEHSEVKSRQRLACMFLKRQKGFVREKYIEACKLFKVAKKLGLEPRIPYYFSKLPKNVFQIAKTEVGY